MPELPEVETIVRQLQQVLPGKVIGKVEVLREKSFGGKKEWLKGLIVKRVGRKAKNIIIEFEKSELVGLVHLKMTGQLIYQSQVTSNLPRRQAGKEHVKRIVGGHPTPDWVNELPSKHTRVIISFKDKSTLFFNDMRVFGWVKVITNDQLSIFMNSLPPDVVDPEFTADYLEKVLKKSTRAVKLVLLDQSKIGGMGNIYVNEALYLAHTKPTRSSKSLARKSISEIYKACVKVIGRGIETGGASENTYKHIDGLGGKYQEEFLVYKREGEACGLNGCRGVIRKVKLGGRGTYYCDKCQK